MPNPENIKPPKKGEPSRNPNGRPKGSPNRSTLLKKWLALKIKFPNRNDENGEKVFDELKEDLPITLEDAITLALIQKAQGGDVAAIKEVFDSLHGKISDKTELTGKDGGEIVTTFKVIKPKADDSAD
jgi:hypothetical protein